MPFKKIEEEKDLACVFNKIDNRKTRICYEENLENIRRVKEIESYLKIED